MTTENMCGTYVAGPSGFRCGLENGHDGPHALAWVGVTLDALAAATARAQKAERERDAARAELAAQAALVDRWRVFGESYLADVVVDLTDEPDGQGKCAGRDCREEVCLTGEANALLALTPLSTSEPKGR